MGGNVVSNLCSLPATDLNFTSELNRATAYQIKQAIEKMKQNGGKNKGRIKACERELENRRLTKKDKNGKYVSKEHLSILCNTFSSEHRLKAILNKLGEYEDAERQGFLLQLPCKEVNRMDNKWIPVSERLPEDDAYILLSYENFTLPDIGRYEVDKDGNGAFYPGDENRSYVSFGLFVNAWMPLPEPYSVDAEKPHIEKPQTNADRIRSMTNEELAKWFDTVTKDVLGGSTWNKNGWLKWLRAESEGTDAR